jgi:hypothetical protein
MSLTLDTEFFGSSVDLDVSMRELEIFLNETENLFSNRANTLRSENEYYDDLDEKHLFYYWFPNLQRRNFIITLISIVEIETRSYCDILFKHNKVAIKYSDLRGTAIEKFINYSEKLAGLEFNYEDNTIDNIKGMTELRNCIVHADGVIEGYRKEGMITEFAKSFGGVIINKGRIYLTKSFCKDALVLVKDFFNEIFKSGYFKYKDS